MTWRSHALLAFAVSPSAELTPLRPTSFDNKRGLRNGLNNRRKALGHASTCGVRFSLLALLAENRPLRRLFLPLSATGGRKRRHRLRSSVGERIAVDEDDTLKAVTKTKRKDCICSLFFLAPATGQLNSSSLRRENKKISTARFPRRTSFFGSRYWT